MKVLYNKSNTIVATVLNFISNLTITYSTFFH